MTSAVESLKLNHELAEHQIEAAHDKSDGFWLYLMSDAVIFALLFATYYVLRRSVAGGPDGHELFGLERVALETTFLLTSSLTFGFANVALMRKQKNTILFWLAVTAALGLGFLFMEVSEFREMIEKGATPQRSAFLSSFFTLVGVHGLHVSVGLVWLLIMLIQIPMKGLTTPVASRLSRLGVFWHFLDIIWIAIFSVVYLPGILS